MGKEDFFQAGEKTVKILEERGVAQEGPIRGQGKNMLLSGKLTKKIGQTQSDKKKTKRK